MLGKVEIEAHVAQGSRVVEAIWVADKVQFRDLTPSMLPEEPGVYVITTREGEVLRVGKAKDQTLRSRIYRNHLMGNQRGNLRAQLVRAGISENMDAAKKWIRQNCLVQLLREQELRAIELEIKWAEHFLIAVLRPRFSD